MNEIMNNELKFVVLPVSVSILVSFIIKLRDIKIKSFKRADFLAANKLFIIYKTIFPTLIDVE